MSEESKINPPKNNSVNQMLPEPENISSVETAKELKETASYQDKTISDRCGK